MVAAWALFVPGTRKELSTMLLGLWLMSSPWILQCHHIAAAAANEFIVGLAVTVLAITAMDKPRAHPSPPRPDPIPSPVNPAAKRAPGALAAGLINRPPQSPATHGGQVQGLFRGYARADVGNRVVA